MANEDDNISAGDLRAQLEKALKEITNLKEVNSKFIEDKAVALFASKGVKPAYVEIAKLKNVDISDNEALNLWITENAETYGFQLDTETVSTQTEGQTVTPVASADIASAQRFNGLSQTAQPSTTPTAREAAINNIQKSRTSEEVAKAIQDALGA